MRSRPSITFLTLIFLARNYQALLGVTRHYTTRQSEGAQSDRRETRAPQHPWVIWGGHFQAERPCSGFADGAVIPSLPVSAHTFPPHSPAREGPTHPVSQLSKTCLGRPRKEPVVAGAPDSVRDPGWLRFQFGGNHRISTSSRCPPETSTSGRGARLQVHGSPVCYTDEQTACLFISTGPRSPPCVILLLPFGGGGRTTAPLHKCSAHHP